MPENSFLDGLAQSSTYELPKYDFSNNMKGFADNYTLGNFSAETPNTSTEPSNALKWFGADGKGGLFGLDSNTLNALGKVGSLAGGLAGTYAGFKQLGLAEDAFNFNKELKEKEYAMAKDAYDKNVARAKSVGDQMRAGSVN